MHARAMLVGRGTYIIRFIYVLVLSRPIVWKCCIRQIVPLLYWHCQKRHQKNAWIFCGFISSSIYVFFWICVYMTVMSSTDLAK